MKADETISNSTFPRRNNYKIYSNQREKLHKCTKPKRQQFTWVDVFSYSRCRQTSAIRSNNTMEIQSRHDTVKPSAHPFALVLPSRKL